MIRPRPLAATALLALAATIAGCAGGAATRSAADADPSDPTVATFDGEALTLREFEDAYARSAGGRALAAADSFPAYADFLERYVDFRLKVREARALGLHEDPELQREIHDYRQQLAKPYFLEREVLEDITRDLYEKQKEEVRAAHLLIRVEEDALPADTLAAFRRASALRDSLAAGADFFALATRHSEDPSVSRNQGDLGYFSAGRMIEPFERMAYATPVGEASPVFRTQFGYHILKVFDRRPAQPEIRASHILVRLTPNATAADSAAARELIGSLRDRIAAGEDFGTLARQYSDDQASGQNGGDLGFFERARMVEPFADAAFALENVGDVSDVVETRFGYHLIQLTGRREAQTYEQKYEQLKQLAERLPRTAARRQEVGRAFRAEVGSTLDTALVREAAAQYPADSLFAFVLTDRFGSYAERPFATIGDSTVTFGRYADFLRRARVRPGLDQPAQLLTLADAYLDEQAIELAAYRLEERDPDFRRIMADYADGVLLFRISEDSVWNAASRDSLGARAYFEANREAYRFPERRRVVAFYSRNDSLLQVVASALDAGQTPAEAAAAVADAEQAVRTDTVYVAAATDSVFDEALTLNVGQRSAIRPFRSERALLYLDGIEEPRPMTFEEARAQVVSAYQDHLDEAFRARLRAKYGARTFPERLRAAFQAEAPAPAVTTAQ